MKRAALSDVIPRKIQKAARRLLEYIEDEEEAFDGLDTAVLDEILNEEEGKEKPLANVGIGSILVDREPEHRRQMLIVVGIKPNSGHFIVQPVEIKKEGYPKPWIDAFVKKFAVDEKAIHPYVNKDSGFLVLTRFENQFYKATEDEYIEFKK
jgi:hypothetical protein